MRTTICIGLVLLLAACVPIGIRGSTQFADTPGVDLRV